MKKRQTGFTLIELMVVIVIIGILVSIALPNFIAAQDRAKVAGVKSNMHTFQIILETYGVDWGGQYPRQPLELTNEANRGGYNKVYKNPFTSKNLLLPDSNTIPAAGGTWIADFITASAQTQVNPFVAISECNGQVLYRRSQPIDNFTKYTIYGLNKDSTYIEQKGQVFTISNE